MELTQEQLDQKLSSFNGDGIEYGGVKERQALTMRLLMIEVVLCRKEDRPGDERVKGFALAVKINTPMGAVNLDDADLKLISNRMDEAIIVKSNDHLYGLLHAFLKTKDSK